MRNVYLYGKLAKEFGSVFRIRANTVGAAVKLLEANFKGKFLRAVIQGEYRVVAGKSIDDEGGLHFDNDLVRSGISLGSKDLHIMPVPHGAGGGGFRVVIGIALIATAVVLSGGAAAGLGATAFSVGGYAVSYGSIALFGASLALGGLAQMLTPTPKVGDYSGREAADERPSFLFNGAVNTVEQGGPVPVIYGRMRVGSTVISGGITTEEI